MEKLAVKVGMFILMEHDLEKAVEFYKNFGFQLRFHLKERWAEFNIDSVKLGLCPTSQQPVERHTGIVLEVKDILKIQEYLLDKGIEFLDEIKEAPHGFMASIKDPGGNIMDLYQPTPEKIREMAEKVAQN